MSKRGVLVFFISPNLWSRFTCFLGYNFRAASCLPALWVTFYTYFPHACFLPKHICIHISYPLPLGFYIQMNPNLFGWSLVSANQNKEQLHLTWQKFDVWCKSKWNSKHCVEKNLYLLLFLFLFRKYLLSMFREILLCFILIRK